MMEKNWMKMEKLLPKNQRSSKTKTMMILKLLQKKTPLQSKKRKKTMLKLNKMRLTMHS